MPSKLLPSKHYVLNVTLTVYIAFVQLTIWSLCWCIISLIIFEKDKSDYEKEYSEWQQRAQHSLAPSFNYRTFQQWHAQGQRLPLRILNRSGVRRVREVE